MVNFHKGGKNIQLRKYSLFNDCLKKTGQPCKDEIKLISPTSFLKPQIDLRPKLKTQNYKTPRNKARIGSNCMNFFFDQSHEQRK